MTKLDQLNDVARDIRRRLKGLIVEADEQGNLKSLRLAKAAPGGVPEPETSAMVRKAYIGDQASMRKLAAGIQAETVEDRLLRQTIEKIAEGWDAMSADDKKRIAEMFPEMDAAGEVSEFKPPEGNQGRYPGPAISLETVKRAAAGFEDARLKVAQAIVPGRPPWER